MEAGLSPATLVMALLEVKRRGSTFLFFAVVVAHIVLISAQVTSKSGVPVLAGGDVRPVAQVQRAGAAVITGVPSLWTGYVDLRGARAENEQLKRDLAATQAAAAAGARARAAHRRALAQLLDLQDPHRLETLAAEVIAGPATPEFRTITIGKGTPTAFGPTWACSRRTASSAGSSCRAPAPPKCSCSIDRNAAAGALVERSRAQGVVLGEGDSTTAARLRATARRTSGSATRS